MGRKAYTAKGAVSVGLYSHAVELGDKIYLYGQTPDDVVKVNVFLTNMENFKAMNSVYEKQFSTPYPSRTTIGVHPFPLEYR